MTIYAWKHTQFGDLVTIVVAADTAAELDQWHARHFIEGGQGTAYTHTHLTEPLEHLFDNDLKPFKKPVMIFTHTDEAQRDAFFAEHSFEEVRSAGAVDRQETMTYLQKIGAESDDSRTIGEVTGTVEHDQWDRTPAEADIMAAPAGVTGHGAGAHGGEGALKKKAKPNSTDSNDVDSVVVRGVTVDADGNVDVDIAVLDDREKEMVRKAREEARIEEEKKKERIRERATEVGLNADAPDTVTAVESDGTVVHHNQRLQITITVSPKGHRIYRDAATGMGVPEKEFERLTKKREAEAQLRDIADEEAAEKAAAEKAAAEEEAQKSDIRKKLDRMRRVVSPAPEEAKPVDPIEEAERLVSEINVEIQGGFSSARLEKILKEMKKAGSLLPDYIVSLEGKLLKNDEDESAGSPTAECKIRRNLVAGNEIFKKLEGQTDQTGPTINRKKPSESQKGDEFCFAVVPPGELGTDATSAILGQEAFIILMPKKNFADGELPTKNGGWFTSEELDDWVEKTGIGVEEVMPSVFKMECNVGDAVRHFHQIGATEHGLLLTSIGVDISVIPFDWPYHYNKKGGRVTDNEMRMQATRILQIAREQGIVLADNDGELTDVVVGVDQAAIAKTEQDVTGEIKRAFGVSGSTEDAVMEILQDALRRAKVRVEEAGLKIDDLQNLPPEITILLDNI